MKTIIKITALAIITILAMLACAPEIEMTQRDFTEIRDSKNPKYDNVITTDSNLPQFNISNSLNSNSLKEEDKEMHISFPKSADILNKNITTAALKEFLSMYIFTNGTSTYTEASVKDTDVNFEFVRRVRYGTGNDEVVIKLDIVPSKTFVVKIDATKYTFANGKKLDKNDNGIPGEAVYDDYYKEITPTGATSLNYYPKTMDITLYITADTISPNTPNSLDAQNIQVATLDLGSYTSASYKTELETVIKDLIPKIKLQKYDATKKTWTNVGTVQAVNPTASSNDWYLAAQITPQDGEIYRTYATGMKNLTTPKNFTLLGITQNIKVKGGNDFGFRSPSLKYNTVISDLLIFSEPNSKQVLQESSPVKGCVVSSDATGKNVKLQIYFNKIDVLNNTNNDTTTHWLKEEKNTAAFNKNLKLVYNTDKNFNLNNSTKLDDLVFIPIKSVSYDSNNRFNEPLPLGLNRITITLDPSYQLSQGRDRIIYLLLSPGFKYDNDLIAFGDFSDKGSSIFIDGVNRWKSYGQLPNIKL